VKGTGRIDGSYGGFNARQRVALAIAALARDDDQERTRLWEKAPKLRYLGHEVAYARVWELASEFATGFAAVHLGPSWAAVQVAGTAGDLIDDLSPITAPLPAGADAYTPISDQPIDVLYALLQQMADRVVTAAAEQVHGFSAFSEHELGVQGLDMIAAFARLFLPIYTAFAAVDADPVIVAKVSDTYQEVWRLRLQRRPIL
jgi:hypothetical protein